MGIFGSYVRGQQHDGSDLDSLIDYDKAPSLVALIEIENMLSDLLGVKVDLVTSKGLKPQLRQHILDEVVYL
jgi:predicted nucleotidyltransferase